MFHFNQEYLNPEDKINGGWAMVAQAVCGFNNNATFWTLFAYCGYWLAVAASVALMKWREGRLTDGPWRMIERKGKGRSPRLSSSSD